MLSNQQILDHMSEYLYGRIKNNGGKLTKGWCDKGGSGERCIMGDLDNSAANTGSAISLNVYKKVVGELPSHILFPKFTMWPNIVQEIIIGNDSKAFLFGKITYQQADEWIKGLALSHGLNTIVWDSLNVENTLNLKDNVLKERKEISHVN